MAEAKTATGGEGESVEELDAILTETFKHQAAATEQRIQREKAAARSPAQRERSRTRKSTSINFRTTQAIKDAANAIAEKRGQKSIAKIVEEAILALAKAEGIDT